MTLFVGILASIAIYGLLYPKNIFGFLMSIEILILASATNMIERMAFGLANVESSVGVLFILVVAGAELAIGLALIVRAFQGHSSLQIDSFHQLKE